MPKALERGNDPPEAPRGGTKASRGPSCHTCPRGTFALSADLAVADLGMISDAPEAPDTCLLAASQLTFKGHPLISLLRETGLRRQRSGSFFARPWGDSEMSAPPSHPLQSAPTQLSPLPPRPGALSGCDTRVCTVKMRHRSPGPARRPQDAGAVLRAPSGTTEDWAGRGTLGTDSLPHASQSPSVPRVESASQCSGEADSEIRGVPRRRATQRRATSLETPTAGGRVKVTSVQASLVTDRTRNN